MKINTNNKKVNIGITIFILIIINVIGIIVGIQFVQFRKYQTEFVIREDVVNEVIKFHEYSKYLEGTVGDSEIYVINGTENTVAVIRKNDASNFNTLAKLTDANVIGIEGSNQYTAASNNLSNITTVTNETNAVAALKNNTCDAIVLSYSQAKNVVETDDTLVISEAIIEKVPSLLVIGGTHPNEPAGQLAATLYLENAIVERGILYVITELNKSAYTYSQPQEGSTWYYNITTLNGTNRTFKFGSRATNTVDQWPTPDVYTHSSGQQLSSSEVRNMNRAYPGSETGTYTEQVAYAITNFINTNDVTMVIDLHEASPEYLTINACVYHQDAKDIISKARAKYTKYVDNDGVTQKLDISYNESPQDMHGLTHRELGDYTNAYVFLFETSNAAQGKLHGAFTEDLITYYKTDKFYEAVVAYDEENGTELIYGRPVSIDERVARHAFSIMAVINGFNDICLTRTITTTARDNIGAGGIETGKFKISNIPDYMDIYNNGVGNYLLPIE